MRLAPRVARAPRTVALRAAPLAVGAQPASKPARLGLFFGAVPTFAPESYPDHVAIVAGLRDHGYVVGQNVVVEFRSYYGKAPEQIPILAAELISRGVDVVITST